MEEDSAESFEQTFGRLQETVARLEQGGLSLDASLQLYESGCALAARCRDLLDAAEIRLSRLSDEESPALGVEEGR